MKKSKLTLRCLCEAAIMIALAQLLGYIKFYELPQGGAITLSMLPIFLFCSRWGFGPGMLASFAFSLLQLFLDGAYAWVWQSIVGDYILGFTVLGFAGLFSKKRFGFFYGALLGCALRFLCSYITGVVAWGEYMPEVFFGMTMTTPCSILHFITASIWSQTASSFCWSAGSFGSRWASTSAAMTSKRCAASKYPPESPGGEGVRCIRIRRKLP